jgi:hypothetical protein
MPFGVRTVGDVIGDASVHLQFFAAASSAFVVVDSLGRLHVGDAVADGALRLASVALPDNDVPVAVSLVSRDRIYVAVKRPDGSHVIRAVGGGLPSADPK